MQILVNVLILIGLFIASGFFSGSETAVFSLSKIQGRRLRKKHPVLSRFVLDHLDHPRRTLMTLLTGNILINTLASAFVTLTALHLWGPDMLTPAIAGYTILLILFCEIIPKVLAARNNEAYALVSAVPLKFFSYLFYPFIFLLRLIIDRVMVVMGAGKREKSEVISEEELKTLVKIGEEEGVFDRQERYMMQKLFELGERPVKEIMTPRVDMVALDIEDSPRTHVEMMKRYHFTHFPVYKDSPDHILGVISVQEYLLSKDKTLKKMIYQPLFVPEVKRIDDLLEEFRKTRQVFCICVDEHGGTAGLVTLEDILEEIFGEYYDEYATVENPIRSFGYREYLVDAKIPISDFNEFFGLSLEPEEAATLGGFILEELGEVPKAGKTLETPDLLIRIQKVVRQRILSVIVRKKQ